MKKVDKRKKSNHAHSFTKVISKETVGSDTSSSASVTNDWRNWVVLHGKDEVVKEDVMNFGKSIGVKFFNDKANQFSSLVRKKDKRKVTEGEVVETET